MNVPEITVPFASKSKIPEFLTKWIATTVQSVPFPWCEISAVAFVQRNNSIEMVSAQGFYSDKPGTHIRFTRIFKTQSSAPFLDLQGFHSD